jgi:very-short-patch-repair endonuclease
MSQLPYIPYNSSNKDYASQNRKAMTPAEQRIWFEIFKNRLIGYKFIRQKMIQSFILDFYCAKLML